MEKLSVIVAQPTSLCNLNCKYCYIPESERQNKLKMEDDVLEAFIKTLFASKNLNKNILLNWHAGEPLTAGIPFYEKACDLIDKYCPKDITVLQSIQTNGILINDKWCDFLKSRKIEISVSIDGPSFIHNANRQTWQGKGSFPLVMKGVEKLRKNSIPFYALMVITQACLDYPDEIYHFFSDQDIKAFGFNIEEVACRNEKSSLNNYNPVQSRYQKFLERLSDLWLKANPKVGIREFERSSRDILNGLNGDKNFKFQIESSKSILTVKRNGDIVPFSPEMASGTKNDPNFFVIGNVMNLSDISQVFKSSKFEKMNTEVRKGVEMCKETCTYFKVCGGGCPGNKYFEHQTFAVSETQFCRHYYKDIIDVLLKHCRN